METDKPRRLWYAIQCQPGKETKARAAIRRQSKIDDLGHLIGRMIIPIVKSLNFKTGGETKVSKQTKFPGYLFVQLAYTEDVIVMMKQVREVGGFVGHPNPVPLSDDEVEKLLLDAAAVRVNPKKEEVFVPYKVGDTVKFKSGPFDGVEGTVKAVNGVMITVTIIVLSAPAEVDTEYWLLELET